MSESPNDLLMLSYQGNIVLLESEEIHTADLRRTVLAVTAITHTHRECFEMLNISLISLGKICSRPFL